MSDAWGGSFASSWGESFGSESQAQAQSFSGGWLYPEQRRTRKDIEDRRKALGILPPEEEARAEEAVAQAAQATVELSQAKPETQAATDAMQAQERAQALFLKMYLAVYPQLVAAQILEAFRIETARRAAELEEEALVILLSSL